MFGDRLKLARKKADYSLQSLSDALGNRVTAQALGKYERNEMMPSSGVLVQLTKTLGVSLHYLLNEQVQKLEDIEFRKITGTRVRERARVSAEVIDHLQRYLTIEEILGLERVTGDMSQCGNRFIGHEEEGEIVAGDIRKAWRLGIDPIPNMTALLENRGFKVLVIDLPQRVSGLTCLVRRQRHKKKIPAIVVNRKLTLERRRFTLAHELAHRLIDSGSPVNIEKASNVFAGAFLVPRDHLIRESGKIRNAIGYRELIYLKRMYRVSAATLLVRFKQTGVIDASTLAYAFQTFARGWRTHEPEPLEVHGKEGLYEAPRRFERLCYRALAEDLISSGKAAELLQQPLDRIEQELRGPVEKDAAYRT